MSATARLLTALVAASLAAGCSAPSAPEDVPAGSATAVTATPDAAEALVAPLTGLPVEAPIERPALAIKISDVRQAHPHVGIDRADLVFVEPVGVSYTRIAAVFHSDLPDRVGPVRSVRPVDAPLLGPLAPVFGNTMGAQWVMDYLAEAANLEDLGTLEVRGSGAYALDRSRPAPDHVFAHPQVLLDLATRTAPPEPYLSYAEDAASASARGAGQPGRSVRVPYGPDWTISWAFDEATGRYLREEPWGPHVTADGTQVSATNVLVLDVEQTTAKIGTGAGAPVPVLDLVDASGTLVALTGGASVTGTWTKGGENEPFELRTDAGEELLLAPGSTWVELPEPGAGVTTE